MPPRDKAQEGETIKGQGHGKRLVQVFSERFYTIIDGFRFSLLAQDMGKHEKLLEQLANPAQDANWNFHDMTGLLQRLGWEMRVRGSHHFFRKTGVRDIINLQPAGSKAKSYQVRQVRNVLQFLGVL